MVLRSEEKHLNTQTKNTQKKLVGLMTMLAFLILLPVARASEANQATKLTFNQAVQIPGRVLPAGTYWFVLAGANTTGNIVQIFNSDRSMVYATILTNNAERVNPNGTEITLADRGSMQPQSIVTWFYPGYTSGHEFIYSKAEEKELARVKHSTIMAAAPDNRQAQTVAVGD
jgi:Protein of unknown function (DUF2911)